MANDIIKNKNRVIGKIPVQKSKYVPEWQRLGKEPVIYEANPSDAMFLNNKKRAPVKTQSPGTTFAPKTKQQIQMAPGQEHAPVQPPKTRKPQVIEGPPQQTKVSSGQNTNWFGSHEDNPNEDISYDEIQTPPDFEVSEEDESVESDEQILKPGEYGVLVKDTFVLKTHSLSDAEAMVEKILFDELPAFSKVTIDDIILIRRLSLKVGVLAVSE